ncbi:uncharacterized protein LOC144132498 isoform X3 [Amblyomma americanum]
MPITAVPSVYHVQRRYSICPATFMGMETGTASITHSVDRDRPLPRGCTGYSSQQKEDIFCNNATLRPVQPPSPCLLSMEIVIWLWGKLL